MNDVSLSLKEKEKEEFGMELFLKECVKIKDTNEIISNDNSADSDN